MAKTYRSSPMFRRIGWYCLIAGVLLPVLADISSRFDPLYDRGSAYSGLVVVIPALAFLYYLYAWRVITDETGLHFRRWFRWHTWPWAWFEANRVEHGAMSFRLKARDDGGRVRRLSLRLLLRGASTSCWPPATRIGSTTRPRPWPP